MASSHRAVKLINGQPKNASVPTLLFTYVLFKVSSLLVYTDIFFPVDFYQAEQHAAGNGGHCDIPKVPTYLTCR